MGPSCQGIARPLGQGQGAGVAAKALPALPALPALRGLACNLGNLLLLSPLSPGGSLDRPTDGRLASQLARRPARQTALRE